MVLFLVVAGLTISTVLREFAVNSSSDPDIYGSIVVWQQFVEGDWDIYYADITNPASPEVFNIADYYDQVNPSVCRKAWLSPFGNIIVWQDNYYGNWDILKIQ